MPTATQAILDAWSPPFWLTISMLVVCVVYARGWRAIRRTRPVYFNVERLLCFIGGMGVLWIAIASPIDGFADSLLSAHMVQHFLLMSAVPPLLLLGAPVVPLLRGLPRGFVKSILGPLIRLRWLRGIAHWSTDPVVAWLAFNIAFLGWHLPRMFDYALRNENVHDLEHICFLSTSLLFWWVILQPWPSRAHHNGWMVLVYLLSADIVNSALSAFLAFSNRPIYQYYFSQPNPFHISPFADQIAGGVLMWVLNSTVFLVPAMLLTFRLAGFSSSHGKRSGVAAGTLPV